MTYRKVFWGVLLVLIGVLFILRNTGILFFHWRSIWQMWPAILILIGITLLPIKDYLKALLSLVILVAAFFVVQSKDDFSRSNFSFGDSHFRWNDSKDDNKWDTVKWSSLPNLVEAYDPKIKTAKLNFDVAVGSFNLKDTSTNLVQVDRSGSIGQYSMTTTGDTSKVINLNFEKYEGNGDIKNNISVKLNSAPQWDFEMHVGAAEVDFDLSNFKTRNVLIEGGASDIELTMGDKLPRSDVSIKAGAADVTLHVPKKCGVEVVSKTFLSSKNFDGFTKVDSHLHQTPGFASSERKIYITIEAGITDVSIERY
jgi:hypothetical protein